MRALDQWPGTAMGYTSLAGVVAELRRALGDDRREPRFLRTVHGHGYAFCGEAEDEPGRSGAARSPFSCYVSWDGRPIGLLPGENVIGRDEACAVRVELPRVSRRHARILVDAGSPESRTSAARTARACASRRCPVRSTSRTAT